MTKVRVVGTVSDFIDNVPILYSKMKLKCRQRNMFTREFTVVRDKDLLPLYVLFDDSCLGGAGPSVQVKMELTLKVFFNKWETDEGSTITSNNH